MEIYKKLIAARKFIRENGEHKKGKNTYSNYDYYTPEQITEMTSNACDKFGLISLFDLKWGEFGITGHLEVVDIESGESKKFEMGSAIPEIKATNATQQVGGALTYTKRYMLMSAFDISDNSLDPDTTHNTKANSKAQQGKQVKVQEEGLRPDGKEKQWLNRTDKEGNVLEAFIKVMEWAKKGNLDINGLRNWYKVSKEVESFVIENLK